MMKLGALPLLVASASAFAPSQSGSRASTAANAAIDDLKSIASKANPIVNFYDPLNLCSVPIWDNTIDQSIGFLRHAEIKHGRVAMAAFVGYIAQSNGVFFPWTKFDYEGLSPPEQWDALPEAGKWQIILFVGFLELFSEAEGDHYMRGGVPGKFPKLTETELLPHPVPFNLYDPFGFSLNRPEEDKARGLICEINNGRLAMLGIMGFLAEQKVTGAVPLLTGVVPHYDGDVMAPFS